MTQLRKNLPLVLFEYLYHIEFSGIKYLAGKRLSKSELEI